MRQNKLDDKWWKTLKKYCEWILQAPFKWIDRQLLVKVALSGFKSPWDNDGTCTFRSRSTTQIHEETFENDWNKLKKYQGQSHEWAWSSGGNEGPEKVACPRWVSVGERCGDRFGALPGVLCHSLKGKATSLSIPWCWCIPCEAVERIVITHTYWNSSSIHLTISFDTVHLCASLIHVNFSFCFWPEPRTCDCLQKESLGQSCSQIALQKVKDQTP